MRRGLIVAIAVALVVVAACGGGSKARPPAAGAAPALPAPNEPLPQDPQALAARLTQVSDGLDTAIGAWLGGGNRARGAPRGAVSLQGLYVQRAYRLLARRSRLASRTLPYLPARLRGSARDSVAALRDLMRLTPPSPKHRRFRIGQAAPAAELVSFYRAAQRRFGVSWNVLAAVNLVETDFNRIRSSSSAGAQGPMQFMASTWRMYGLGGNVHDPHDAILGAANYLHRSGAPDSYRQALYHYNPSPLYVDAVLRYAREMAASAQAFFRFYPWQVFVRTSSGDRRITGP